MKGSLIAAIWRPGLVSEARTVMRPDEGRFECGLSAGERLGDGNSGMVL